MRQEIFEIVSNNKLTSNVYKLTLKGNASTCDRPGSFVNIKLDGYFLRRPISVNDVNGDKLDLIYKVVGKGTEYLSTLSSGKLDLLTDLGNGYNLDKSGENPLLIGGGCGVPPLYMLAKKLLKQGKKVTVILGFNTKDEIFYEQEFIDLGCEVFVTTVDGSYGIKGFVTNAMEKLNYSYTYSCGPLPMLKAVFNASKTSGEYSFEERMGCGFGACMGCSCKTNFGNKRICKDGPVFVKEEILW